MIREFFRAAAISILIILPVFTLISAPDCAFGAEQEEAKILIKDFRIIGNEAINDETILNAISSYRNNEYTLEELKFIADVVTMMYQEQGYMLAKAYIPVQYIQDNIVKVVVVEGNLGSLEISYSNYYSQGLVCNFFSDLVGKAVNESDIERAILMANETPSMNVQTAFKKGELPGTTDLKIEIEDTYPIFFDFEYNNYGNPLVSRNRYIANFSMTDPAIGSTLALTAMIGDQLKDTFYGAIDLTIPVNYEGTKVGMRYINADYIVGRELYSYGFQGEAEIMGAYLAHPFLHSRNQKLKATLGFDMKRVFGYRNSSIVKSNDDLSVWYLRLDYDTLDRFLGKNYLSFTFSEGLEDFMGSSKLNDPMTSRSDGDGKFEKYNADYVRIQRLWEKLLLLFKTSGQYASQRLVATEQFNLGGAYTVRGHDLSRYISDHGYLVSTELSTPLPFVEKINISDRSVSDMIRIVAFIDHGGAYIQNLQAGEDNSEYATGVGVGARFYLFDRVNVKLDVGWPLKNGSVALEEDIIYAQVTAKVIKF